MEAKLKKLFDYQRFEQSPRLEKLISETQARSAAVLSDEDLELVSAAGAPETVRQIPTPDDLSSR